jgi:hypothetical protein
MRTLVLALAAVAFATAAGAVPGPAQGPYRLDHHGKCRAAGGEVVLQRLCHVPPKSCRDPHTRRHVKCNTPGAVLAE